MQRDICDMRAAGGTEGAEWRAAFYAQTQINEQIIRLSEELK